MKYEVKYAIAAEGQIAALAGLTVDEAEVDELTIHFFDTDSLSRFAAGQILRVRQVRKSRDGDPDDATCKLRGEEAAAAHAKWGKDFPDRKLEADKNVGAPAKQSFSITTEPPPDEIAMALAGDFPLASLLEADAVALSGLAEGEWKTLLAYGPIHSRKWKVKVAGLAKKATVEHWATTDGTTLLEVSAKVEEPDVAGAESALLAFLRDGLKVPQFIGSKTEFALRHSAKRPLT